MSQQAVVESTDVFLTESTTTETNTDTKIAQSIANTRLVSQDTLYAVESVEIVECNDIRSFYIQDDDNFTKVKWIPETATLFSSHSNEELQKSDITVGTLTTDHLKNNPQGSVSGTITPIDPIQYNSKTTEETIYFANVHTEYVVKFHLKSETGNRQTVYKTVPSKQTADDFTRISGSTIQFHSNEQTVHLELVDEQLPDNDTGITSQKSRKEKLLKYLVSTPAMALALWVIPVQGFVLLTQDILPLNPALTVMGSIVVWAVVFDKLVSKTSSTAESEEHYTDSNKTEFYETQDTPISISLTAPDSLDAVNPKTEPVTEVNITPHFEDSKLILSVKKTEDTLKWEYKTNDEGVFTDTTIVDFYTELGFDAVESSSFTAYVSPNRYSVSPKLTSSDNIMYLYPEDPTT